MIRLILITQGSQAIQLIRELFSIGYRVSLISVDLPLPETPVIPTIKPSGILISTLLKLFLLKEKE